MSVDGKSTLKADVFVLLLDLFHDFSIRVESFTPPNSAFNLRPGQGIQWSATGVGIKVRGDFRYKALVSDYFCFLSLQNKSYI